MLARHGPHHVAQKSTTTGRLRRSESRIDLPSSVRTENAGAGRACATSGATRVKVSAATKLRDVVASPVMSALVSRPSLEMSAHRAKTLTAIDIARVRATGICHDFDRVR